MDPVIDLDPPRGAGAPLRASPPRTSCATAARSGDARRVPAAAPDAARTARRGAAWSRRSWPSALALAARRARGALVAAAALLAAYGAAIGVNLARGRRHIDCGCVGPAARRPIGGWLVARNGVLAAPSRSPGSRAGRRARPLVWVDALTVVGGDGRARRCCTRPSSACWRTRRGSRAARRRRDAGARRLERRPLGRRRRARVRRRGARAADRRPLRAGRAGRRAARWAAGRRSARRRRSCDAEDLRGPRARRSAAPRDDGRSTLALLPLADLPRLQDAAAGPALASRAARRDWLDVVLASDGPRDEHEAFVRAERLDAFALRAVAAARHDLAGGQAAVRRAARRGGRRARARVW